MALNDDWADLSDDALVAAVQAELPAHRNDWLAASFLVRGSTMAWQAWGVQDYREAHRSSFECVADRLRAIGRLKGHISDPRPWTEEQERRAQEAARFPDKGRAVRWTSHIRDERP